MIVLTRTLGPKVWASAELSVFNPAFAMAYGTSDFLGWTAAILLIGGDFGRRLLFCW
jgi:hypothetical protein